MNIQLSYLYRDGGNYKFWGSVVFDNPNKVSADLLMKKADELFGDDWLFIADQIGVAELFPISEGYPSDDDHCFHEFVEFVETLNVASDPFNREIEEFLNCVQREQQVGWRAFDPKERFEEFRNI